MQSNDIAGLCKILGEKYELEAHPFSFQKEPSDAPFEHLLASNTCPTRDEEAAVDHQLELTTKKLKVIKARASDLEAMLHATRREQWEQERRHRSYSRILATVRKLPQEVLREVFLHLHAVYVEFPLSLSLVCSSWRNVILTTPHLWTEISITKKTIPHCKLLFERSGSILPLTVIFKNWKEPESIDMEWLADYIPRVERLKLSAVPSVPPHISNIPTSSWHNLRDLTLQMKPHAWETVGGKLWGPTSLSPPLTRLRLEHVGIPPRAYPLPFDTLTRLEILAANPKINMEELMALLQSCSKLKLFAIVSKSTEDSNGLFEDITESPDAVTKRITMPYLQELHIEFGRATVWFLNRIILPSLLHLTMSDAIGWQDAFEALAKRSSFSLKHLGMKRCKPGDPSPPPSPGPYDTEYYDRFEVYGSKTDAMEEQALTVLKISPSIETLHIFESMPFRKHLLDGLQGDKTTQQEPIGPNLKHLWVYDGFPLTDLAAFLSVTKTDIHSMIEARRPMSKPAKTISWDNAFGVYSSGDPLIPVLSMEVGDIYDEFQDRRCGTSVHIFF